MKNKKISLLIIAILIITTACSKCPKEIDCTFYDETNRNFPIVVKPVSVSKTFQDTEFNFCSVYHANDLYNWSILMPIPYTVLQQDVIDWKLSPDLPDLAYVLEDAKQTISFKKYDISSFSNYPIKYFAQLKKKSFEDNFDKVTMKEIDIEGHDAWYYTYTREYISYKTILFEDENALFTITYDYLTDVDKIHDQISNYSLSTISFK